jgi:undecaprenyl pyrophosphate phosphatase UppP
MFAARQSDLTPAQRAHVRRVLWLVLLYVVIVPPLVWLRATRHISEALVLLMAVAASLPCLGFIASWGRYMSDERDEYHQSVNLRRNAVATNVTMGAAVVWGCLQAFGAMPLMEAYWIPLVWVVMQGVFACIDMASSRKGERR